MTHDTGRTEGVGAFNARREVVLFTDPLAEMPDGYRTRGNDIDILAGEVAVHNATYGTLIADGAAGRDDVILMELDDGGEPVRATTLARRS